MEAVLSGTRSSGARVAEPGPQLPQRRLLPWALGRGWRPDGGGSAPALPGDRAVRAVKLY